MTIEQTYQLGMEFERRLIEIDPSFEIENKVDTETIYKFLNEYCQQYVQQLMIQLIQVKDRPEAIPSIQDRLRTLIKTEKCRVFDNPIQEYKEEYKNVKHFLLPANYYMYINSSSICSKSYKHPQETSAVQLGVGIVKQTHMLSNKVCSEYDINEVIDTLIDSGAIMRSPVVVLESIADSSDQTHNAQLFHDKYTEVDSVYVTYYSLPGEFSILKNPEEPCELPYTAFWDIVKGAVDLYIYTYKYGVTLESLKRKAKQQMQALKDAANNKKEDEE